jgi:hypothetical protein
MWDDFTKLFPVIYVCKFVEIYLGMLAALLVSIDDFSSTNRAFKTQYMYGTQQNDTQHNNTQYSGLYFGTQHKRLLPV